MNAINPEFEDEESFNPFDFWEGAPFKLKIRNYEGFRNYDKSEFGDRGPLMESDEAMEKVWKSQYSLTDLLDPKNFKGYDEIKTRFNTFISNAGSARPTTDDGGDDSDEAPVTRNKPQPSSAPRAATTTTADDDDLELFRNMIDD